ncbi:uncharacterized protein LOC121980718 isoform X1 [Zingiber officinale]|uniref:uncharacterized protein LOC121980718 isoform X1 n=1 Tax=Zingiber officinale TaxID=94328 RepID=UPI001C4B9F26|nr:uncharacterized protein LOC121980718 isoform X1 [Zingiber officinale]XP_042388821.1 uncharacterized protein LOC121980718 isoform X1 [Zingiber officinale]
MDSSATSKAGEGRTGRICSGFCFCVISYFVVSFLTSFLLGLLGLAIDRFSASAAVAIPTTCRILSSGVDLKASKVCQLGTLNHKANGAFYHLKKATFRCHYDYYWASIFEVQFEEYFSGQIFHAVAEVPKEALPHDCRPDFGIAWLTTLKFKVNETYGCKYLPVSQKVDIYSDGLFGCKAKQFSTSNPIMPYINLLMGLFIEAEGPGSNTVYVARGFICGFLVSMLTVATAECFRILAGAMARRQTCIVWLQRVCIIVAYFSAMAWLILQYGKMIGLNQLLFDSKTYERTS